MKKLIKILVSALAVLSISAACSDMSEEQKKESGDAFSKAVLAGEYGVVNITGTADGGETELPLFGDNLSFTDDKGRPVTVLVLGIDGTWFMAPNRVWKHIYSKGLWDVSSDELQLKGESESEPDETYKITDFKDNCLYLKNGNATMVLKRLSEADKCQQLKSIEFVENVSGGKLTIDPRIELTNGAYKLTWKYDPEDYEPYNDVRFTSSNSEVATVNSEGYVTPVESVGTGQTTTITIFCDYVQADITLEFFTVN